MVHNGKDAVCLVSLYHRVKKREMPSPRACGGSEEGYKKLPGIATNIVKSACATRWLTLSESAVNFIAMWNYPASKALIDFVRKEHVAQHNDEDFSALSKMLHGIGCSKDKPTHWGVVMLHLANHTSGKDGMQDGVRRCLRFLACPFAKICCKILADLNQVHKRFAAEYDTTSKLPGIKTKVLGLRCLEIAQIDRYENSSIPIFTGPIISPPL